MIDLISILIDILIGQACGVLISIISLENAKEKLSKDYKKYLEKERKNVNR